MPQSSAPVDPVLRKRLRNSVLIMLLIAALGGVVWLNYYIKYMNDLRKGHLPVQGRVETDWEGGFVDQNGTPRKLDALLGKVVVWSCVYTTCPSKCSGVQDEMKKLRDEFGSDPRFHLVSVCFYPENDRPGVIKAWTDAKGLQVGDNWWFLTGPKGTPEEGDSMRKWLLKSLRFNVTKNSDEHLKNFPTDKWAHAFVLTMTDHKANIRTPTNSNTFWEPFNEAFEGWNPRDIRIDIKKLLEEAPAK